MIKITRNMNYKKAVEEGSDRALLTAAIAVTAQAKKLSPVDFGQLRNSIMYKIHNGEEGGFNESGGESAEEKIASTNEKQTAFVGTNLEYGHYVEFGTKTQEAQPYLRPAGEVLRGLGAVGRSFQKGFSSRI